MAIFAIFDLTERKMKQFFFIDSNLPVDNEWVSTKNSDEMWIWSISEAPEVRKNGKMENWTRWRLPHYITGRSGGQKPKNG